MYSLLQLLHRIGCNVIYFSSFHIFNLYKLNFSHRIDPQVVTITVTAELNLGVSFWSSVGLVELEVYTLVTCIEFIK